LNSRLCTSKQALHHLNHTSSPFCYGNFGAVYLQTIFLGLPQTVILLILASQVARIIGMSHWYLDHLNHFKVYSSMILNVFKMLYNHHHYPSPSLFSCCKAGTLYSLNNNFPFLSSTMSQKPTFYFLFL
jgi:hypothetical protein